MPDQPATQASNSHGLPSRIVPLRLTDAEQITYQKAAERSGQSLIQWIHERLDQAAKREAKEA